MNAIDYVFADWRLAAMLASICLVISLGFILWLWIVHGGGSVVGRVAWSIVLLVPIFGWLFFAAFHHAPRRLAGDGHAEHGQAATGEPGYGAAEAGGD